MIFSPRSFETYTFISDWRKCTPTLENVVCLTLLPFFGEANVKGIVLQEEDQLKLKFLLEEMMLQSHRGNPTNAIWLGFSYEGNNSRSNLGIEAFPTYCLSWYVKPSGLEDGLNRYVFLLVILFARVMRFTWPISTCALCMQDQKGVQEISPGEWVNMMWSSIWTWFHTSFHLGEVPSDYLKIHRVSHNGLGGGDAGRQLEEDEGITHVQTSGMEVVKHEATWQ